MRIGVDMFGVQSPHHGHRGIGRYGVNLVASLLARRDGHDYVFYVHEELPDQRVPAAPHAQVRRLGPGADLPGATVTQRMDRLIRTNPDHLDAFLVLSAFEPWGRYTLPARPLGRLRMAAVVHDLIPFLFPDENAYDATLMHYYRSLDELRRYDVLLTNSEATRQDCLSVLNLPEDQVVTIGGGCDPRVFTPDDSVAGSEEARAVLDALGIVRPFVLNVGGLVERKNTWGLIDAFARLPESIRQAHHLVLTFATGPHELEDVRRYARATGIEPSLVLTNEVSDEVLRVLYRRCAVFVFPSLYEGFGLPLIEAMQCGAAVIAGNNSSQIEVVGDAGLLANVSDPSDIAAKLVQVLDDPARARDLRARGVDQARHFRWEFTAERAERALAGLERRRPTPRFRIDRAHAAKPRIAYFSPLPPRKSGISDYSVFLLAELKKTYAIDLYHDAGYRPDLAWAGDEFECLDYRLFEHYARARDYHTTVYQMGNSRYHVYMYDLMLRYPGVATLHDFCLAGFHFLYGHRIGHEHVFITGELKRSYPDDAAAIDAVFAGRPPWDREALAKECARRGWVLNHRMFEAGNHVVVHSPWCLGQIEGRRPEHAEQTTIIPHGIWPRAVSADERAAIRYRFDVPREALVVASFGFIHPDKMNPEAIEAFGAVAASDPSAVFLLAGEDADGGVTRRRAADLGLLDRVRFLGRQSWANFTDLIAATDLGINLRLPPTNGETSGALLVMLAAGVPTIVTDVATFGDYPSDVVRKVRWESEGIDGLRSALVGLARDPAARARLCRSAADYVAAHHVWPRVAEQYVAAIERVHTAPARRRGPLLETHVQG